MFAIFPVFVLAGLAWLASMFASALAVAFMLYLIWRIHAAYPVLKVRVRTRVSSLRKKEA